MAKGLNILTHAVQTGPKSDRRKHPRCSKTNCRRAAMNLFNGNFSDHCYVHATKEEWQVHKEVYRQKIQDAIETRQAELEFGEHLGPEHYRIEPGD